VAYTPCCPLPLAPLGRVCWCETLSASLSLSISLHPHDTIDTTHMWMACRTGTSCDMLACRHAIVSAGCGKRSHISRMCQEMQRHVSRDARASHITRVCQQMHTPPTHHLLHALVGVSDRRHMSDTLSCATKSRSVERVKASTLMMQARRLGRVGMEWSLVNSHESLWVCGLNSSIVTCSVRLEALACTNPPPSITHPLVLYPACDHQDRQQRGPSKRTVAHRARGRKRSNTCHPTAACAMCAMMSDKACAAFKTPAHSTKRVDQIALITTALRVSSRTCYRAIPQ